MKLASVQKIDGVAPIEGADKIELVKILGYQSVSKKGEFKAGDICIWIEPDTTVPFCPWSMFLAKDKKMDSGDRIRLKAIKLRGEVSQGLALPVPLVLGYPEGRLYEIDEDLTEELGIHKYEKPLSPDLVGVAAGSRPSFIRKTDEDNFRSNPRAFAELIGKNCVVTKKVDGSSATYFYKDGVVGVCSRNLELKESESNAFWQAGRESGVIDALKKDGQNLAVQAELYGPGINGNKTKGSKVKLAIFDLWSIDRLNFFSHNCMQNFCAHHSLPVVEVVKLFTPFSVEDTMDSLVQLANEQTYGDGIPAEGIVIRPLEEAYSERFRGRLSGKIISEKYAVKHGE